jgi:hypothetical protein
LNARQNGFDEVTDIARWRMWAFRPVARGASGNFGAGQFKPRSRIIR